MLKTSCVTVTLKEGLEDWHPVFYVIIVHLRQARRGHLKGTKIALSFYGFAGCIIMLLWITTDDSVASFLSPTDDFADVKKNN